MAGAGRLARPRRVSKAQHIAARRWGWTPRSAAPRKQGATHRRSPDEQTMSEKPKTKNQDRSNLLKFKQTTTSRFWYGLGASIMPSYLKRGVVPAKRHV